MATAPLGAGKEKKIQIPLPSARAWDLGGVGELMMLAMIVKPVHTIALVTLFLAVCCDGQKLIGVMVGRKGGDLRNKFTPEEVFADVGDMIQFQFYPLVSFVPC